ncbi:hypothetical protein KY304_00720 [Candidatus Woesearchaeota archaeon]|nr:hypothetical protein [Candidatus Woesearchaeota archaeon]
MVFKNNNPEFYLGLIVVAAISFFVGSFFAGNTGAVISIESSIDVDGAEPGFFEISPGSIAKDFSASISKNTKGWGIYSADVVNGEPVPKSYVPVYHTTYGDLSGFALGPGKYVALVDGWPGADVVVYYKVE